MSVTNPNTEKPHIVYRSGLGKTFNVFGDLVGNLCDVIGRVESPYK